MFHEPAKFVTLYLTGELVYLLAEIHVESVYLLLILLIVKKLLCIYNMSKQRMCMIGICKIVHYLL